MRAKSLPKTVKSNVKLKVISYRPPLINNCHYSYAIYLYLFTVTTRTSNDIWYDTDSY